MKSKIYFDTEFTGLHQKTTLISIGLVSDSGKTFYAEFTDYDKTQIDEWLDVNILSKLKYHKIDDKETILNEIKFNENSNLELVGDTKFIKKYLVHWLCQFEEIEMYSDCLSYDWVLFNNIFGTAFDIPKNIYYIPFDLCTSLKDFGFDPDISREGFCTKHYSNITKKDCIVNLTNKHNALHDAEIIKKCYEILEKMKEEKNASKNN